ncbi:MAG: 23S rRNA (guanosine2251-2'-O)-methyltransferase [Rhodospirillaceae bacterium]|nr:MAG: 23S rRNA (guanosine2251-2'-O)-methyltransferase [Rhodospirillaceae bacterium]
MNRRKSFSSQLHSSSAWSGQGEEGWIHGRHAALAALANRGRHCRRLLVTNAMAGPVADIIAGLQAQGYVLPPLEIVERAVIETIAPGGVHQGIAVQVSPLEPLPIDIVAERASAHSQAVVVMLDQVTDPRNVGAVVRSAAAFDALAVVVQERHAPMETGTLAKAASGGLETVPLVRAINLVRAIETLKDAGFWTVGLEAGASLLLAETDLSGRIALVLGSEGRGLRRLVRIRCDSLARLPVTGKVGSLNVSSAATVALYEVACSRLATRQAPHRPAGVGGRGNLVDSTCTFGP